MIPNATTERQRQTPRVQHNFEARLIQPDGSSQTVSSVDISLAGIGLALAQPVATERPVKLSLLLPNDDGSRAPAPLEIKARVVWQRDDQGLLRCGAEFMRLSASQKRRLEKAFVFARSALAASIAGLLMHATPALAASATTTQTAVSASTLSADILNAQRAANAASASLQVNLGKALQDVLNLQKNAAGSNSATLQLIYQASAAASVARLSADGVALKAATDKLNALTAATITANTQSLRQATATYEKARQSGNTATIAAAKKAVDQAADVANNYVKNVYGILAPSVTAKLQTGIAGVAKQVTALGASLLAKDKVAIEARKAEVMTGLTNLAQDYIAMTQPQPAPSAAAKPTVQDTIVNLAKGLDSLVITQADGKKVSATSLLTSALSNLLKSPTAGKTTPIVPTGTSTTPTKAKLHDGSEFAYMASEPANPADTLGVFGANAEMPQDRRIGYAMLTDKAGATTAVGFGYSAQYSYAKALYGDDDMARMSERMSVANVSAAAGGGGLLAHGMQLDEDTRLAVSWSGTANDAAGLAAALDPAQANAKSTHVGIGLSHRVDERLTAGLNVGQLNEKHAILGNSYDPNAAVGFGDNNRTTSVGLTAAYRFDDNNVVLAEASVATTRGGNAAGLIADTTDIKSRSWGMTFTSKNLIGKGDGLTVSMTKPLHVVSGQAAVWTAETAANGTSTLTKTWLDLAPAASETDVRLNYDAPLKGNQALSVQASYRKNMQNQADNNEATLGLAWKAKF